MPLPHDLPPPDETSLDLLEQDPLPRLLEASVVVE
jgi:hypothetical protein